jgi:diadenosine tetraphosphatase ApaH/serine/threonine PP2A family protein phosphatase
LRVAILSDIHGNLEALEAVLAHLSAEAPDRMACLGDVVGYGADPNACTDVVRDSAGSVLAGNHDWAVAGREGSRHFNTMALAAIRWTESTLTADNADWLEGLPLEAVLGEAHLVHASPNRPATWPYISHPVDAPSALAHTEARICFVGHSHHAFVAAESGLTEVVGEGQMKLKTGERYLVNAGSVGQPRDGDNRAAFIIWDQEENEIRIHRISYDVKKAQSKIREAGLPAFLAERLGLGW